MHLEPLGNAQVGPCVKMARIQCGAVFACSPTESRPTNGILESYTNNQPPSESISNLNHVELMVSVTFC